MIFFLSLKKTVLVSAHVQNCFSQNLLRRKKTLVVEWVEVRVYKLKLRPSSGYKLNLIGYIFFEDLAFIGKLNLNLNQSEPEYPI